MRYKTVYEIISTPERVLLTDELTKLSSIKKNFKIVGGMNTITRGVDIYYTILIYRIIISQQEIEIKELLLLKNTYLKVLQIHFLSISVGF